VATTRPLSEILPKEMTELRTRPLFTLLLDVAPPINVGKSPGIDRRIGVITGGRFDGGRLRGEAGRLRKPVWLDPIAEVR